MKTLKFIATVLFLLYYTAIMAQLSPTLSFLTKFRAKSAIVTDYAYKDTIPAPSALIRLPNEKIVYMVKKNGIMEPFYIKAIETGYWDTRYDSNTNYDTIFADMRQTGANTAYVMIHWEDIETSDNTFSFSFPDTIVAAAARQQLKLKWILFLHAQTNGVPSHNSETAWTFHLDDRDSCNYTMQWPKRNGEIYKTIKHLNEKGGIRPLHVYGHPEIFYRIRRMLYKLATHYHNDNTVIGIQIGNEEGFSFLDDSDYNPITAELYEEWKIKTNKTDYAQFKKEAINWWWKQFTTAYHEGDPYKIISFNLDAAQAEAGEEQRVKVSGTSAATYADGNLDVIGTMLYKNWGYKALIGLDTYYNEGRYTTQLPILIPSEIGIGRFNTPHNFKNFVLQTLERGAQGFGVYCYGEIRKELPDTTNIRQDLINMFANIQANEDLIFAGLPGPGYMQCYTEDKNLKISHLNVNKKSTLAIIYQPEVEKEQSQKAEKTLTSHTFYLKPKEVRTYHIRIYCAGQLISTKKYTVNKEKGAIEIRLPNYYPHDALFINIQ